MSYLDITNLYKSKDILLFKECYAMEKIHGTSAHISWKEGKLSFFSGGSKHETFVALFNQEELNQAFTKLCVQERNPDIVVFGEAYGGKCQGMKETYGNALKFVAFEVKIGNSWLDVLNAEKIVLGLGLEFVHYRKIPATVEAIEAEILLDSVQAIRNGMGDGKMREGVVLRPMIEVRKNNLERVISKHKREEFREHKTPRPLDAENAEVMKNAHAIADEWCTEMRLLHVLDAFPDAGIEDTGNVIKAMLSDIEREGVGELEMSREAKKIIGAKTASMFKKRLLNNLECTTCQMCDTCQSNI